MQASSGANRLHRIQWYVLRPRYVKIILDGMRKNSLLQKFFWNRSDDDSQSERRNGSFAVASVSIRNAIYLPDMLRHKRIQVRLNSRGRATIIYDKFFFYSAKGTKYTYYRSTSSLRTNLLRFCNTCIPLVPTVICECVYVASQYAEEVEFMRLSASLLKSIWVTPNYGCMLTRIHVA